jgi:hypothetical protein
MDVEKRIPTTVFLNKEMRKFLLLKYGKYDKGMYQLVLNEMKRNNENEPPQEKNSDLLPDWTYSKARTDKELYKLLEGYRKDTEREKRAVFWFETYNSPITFNAFINPNSPFFLDYVATALKGKIEISKEKDDINAIKKEKYKVNNDLALLNEERNKLAEEIEQANISLKKEKENVEEMRKEVSRINNISGIKELRELLKLIMRGKQNTQDSIDHPSMSALRISWDNPVQAIETELFKKIIENAEKINMLMTADNFLDDAMLKNMETKRNQLYADMQETIDFAISHNVGKLHISILKKLETLILQTRQKDNLRSLNEELEDITRKILNWNHDMSGEIKIDEKIFSFNDLIEKSN